MELAELMYEECHAEEYINDISEPSENDSESQIEIELSRKLICIINISLMKIFSKFHIFSSRFDH